MQNARRIELRLEPKKASNAHSLRLASAGNGGILRAWQQKPLHPRARHEVKVSREAATWTATGACETEKGDATARNASATLAQRC